MAMTKKERAEFDALQQQLAEAKAFRFTKSVARDVPMPDTWGVNSSGWNFNPYTHKVIQAWSSSVYHGEGAERTRNGGASQGALSLFSTKVLALRALRNNLEQTFARELAKVDAEIAIEEVHAASQPQGDPKP